MNLHWVEPVGNGWDDVKAELRRAFIVSRAAAIAEESFVYVLLTDDLLGRGSAGDAMVAAGLVSAARTAAVEGSRKGWTANVIACDAATDRAVVAAWAEHLLVAGGVTGEVIHLGPGHLGKALP